jgi:hypothetical protein
MNTKFRAVDNFGLKHGVFLSGWAGPGGVVFIILPVLPLFQKIR